MAIAAYAAEARLPITRRRAGCADARHAMVRQRRGSACAITAYAPAFTRDMK